MSLNPDLLPFLFVDLFIEVVEQEVLLLRLEGVEGREGGLKGTGVEGDPAQSILDALFRLQIGRIRDHLRHLLIDLIYYLL